MTITVSILKFSNILSRCSVFTLSFLIFSVFSVAVAANAAEISEGGGGISIQRGTENIVVFTVEAVSDQQRLQKGLSGRPSIPDDFSMLFILDSAGEQFFWMKGMKFPIDLLFFGKDKKLIKILPNLLPCEECAQYQAPADTAYALEVNGGLADILGIKKGDSIVFTDK